MTDVKDYKKLEEEGRIRGEKLFKERRDALLMEITESIYDSEEFAELSGYEKEMDIISDMIDQNIEEALDKINKTIVEWENDTTIDIQQQD